MDHRPEVGPSERVCTLKRPLSVIQPPKQIIKRNHDVLPKGGTRLEPLIPGLDVRNIRAGDVQVEIAVEMGARRYVCQRQVLAGQEVLLAQYFVEQLKVLRAQRDVFFDRFEVPLSFWSSVETPEHAG